MSKSAKQSAGTRIAKAVPKQKKRIRTTSFSDKDASAIFADGSDDESGSEGEEGHSFRLRDVSALFSFRLRDVSVLFPEGALTVVTGPTASGKTALLVWCLDFLFSFSLYLMNIAQLAVLGEMTLLDGQIVMSKDSSRVDENGFMYCISYAAQSPWLRHQSIKDNILFGYPFDEERYNMVVECCALKPDFDMLEDGDATEIGARYVFLILSPRIRLRSDPTIIEV